MSVVYNLFRGMLMVPRNTMEMMHRTLKSSMLNRDSGSGIQGCRGISRCFSTHLDATRCLAPYEIESDSTAGQ